MNTRLAISKLSPLCARLGAAGIEAPVIISFDDVEHGKPHPQGYLLGARRLEVEPARTAGVEDSAPGLAAARAAGTLVVAVGGSRDGDVVCRDLHELRRFLIAAADQVNLLVDLRWDLEQIGRAHV